MQNAMQSYGNTKVDSMKDEITLRDRFAMHALVNLSSTWTTTLNPTFEDETRGQWLARNAYALADYMLEEREKYDK